MEKLTEIEKEIIISLVNEAKRNSEFDLNLIDNDKEYSKNWAWTRDWVVETIQKYDNIINKLQGDEE